VSYTIISKESFPTYNFQDSKFSLLYIIADVKAQFKEKYIGGEPRLL
jgi:hypothetical protein